MTPNEIQNKRFDKGMSGYKADDVHGFLFSVAEYVEGILEEKNELEQKIMVLAEKLEEYREDEDSLRAALIGAQKLGDSVVRESKAKAEAILADARKKSDIMTAQIKQNIERETYALNQMQAEVARFKKQIIAMYTSHIELLNTIPYDVKDFPEQTAAPVKQKPRVAPEERHEPEPVPDDAQNGETVLEFEEVEALEEPPKKEPRHRDLGMFFGEKSPVTRKD